MQSDVTVPGQGCTGAEQIDIAFASIGAGDVAQVLEQRRFQSGNVGVSRAFSGNSANGCSHLVKVLGWSLV